MCTKREITFFVDTEKTSERATVWERYIKRGRAKKRDGLADRNKADRGRVVYCSAGEYKSAKRENDVYGRLVFSFTSEKANIDAGRVGVLKRC